MIYHRHPSGFIFIRKTELGDLRFTVQEFQNLVGYAYDDLPAGCKERIYDMETGWNVLFTDDNRQIDGGDFPAVVTAYLTEHPDFIGRVLNAATAVTAST